MVIIAKKKIQPTNDGVGTYLSLSQQNHLRLINQHTQQEACRTAWGHLKNHFFAYEIFMSRLEFT